MALKGYIYIIIALFFISMAPVGVDYLMQYNNPETVSVVWSLSAFIFIMIIFIYKKEYKNIMNYDLKTILILWVLCGITVVSWFYSIEAIGGSLTSLIGRIGTLVIVVLSIVFLKEKFSFSEIIGGVIILIGAYIITFSPIEYLGIKIIYIVIASVLYAINQIIIKKNINKMSPVSITMVLLFGAFIFVITYGIFRGRLEVPHTKTLVVAGIVPLFSEVIAVLLVMNSYKFLDVSKAQIVRTSYPFVVVLYSWILFKKMLLMHQLIGGVLIIIGVVVLIGFRKTKG